MLATAKSTRTVNSIALLNKRQAEIGGRAQIYAVAHTSHRVIEAQIDIETALDLEEVSKGPGYRMVWRVNGIQQNHAEDFVGHIKVVTVSSDAIKLPVAKPASRLRFLNILIAQVNRHYLRSLQRSIGVQNSRNDLLRKFRGKAIPKDEIRFWNERLAYEAATLMIARRNAISAMSTPTRKIYSALGYSGELNIHYQPAMSARGNRARAASAPGDALDGVAHQDLYARLEASLRANAQHESRTGLPVTGPPLDDFLVMLNKRPLPNELNSAEKSGVALAVNLAAAEYVQRVTSECPIIAIDDCACASDPESAQRLMDALQPYEQVILACDEGTMRDTKSQKTVTHFTISEDNTITVD